MKCCKRVAVILVGLVACCCVVASPPPSTLPEYDQCSDSGVGVGRAGGVVRLLECSTSGSREVLECTTNGHIDSSALYCDRLSAQAKGLRGRNLADERRRIAELRTDNVTSATIDLIAAPLVDQSAAWRNLFAMFTDTVALVACRRQLVLSASNSSAPVNRILCGGGGDVTYSAPAAEPVPTTNTDAATVATNPVGRKGEFKIRYVRIQYGNVFGHPLGAYLQYSEIEAYAAIGGDNIMRLATMSMSSTATTGDQGYSPGSMCNDGILTNYCHTDSSSGSAANQWLEADFRGDVSLRQLIVWPRQSCCPERSDGHVVLFMDSSRTVLWSYRLSVPSGDTSPITIDVPAKYYTLSQTVPLTPNMNLYAATTGFMRTYGPSRGLDSAYTDYGIMPAKVPFEPGAGKFFSLNYANVYMSCCNGGSWWGADGHTSIANLASGNQPDADVRFGDVIAPAAVGVWAMFTKNNAMPATKPAFVDWRTSYNLHTYYEPQLGQPFFVGDGETPNGCKQVFRIPDDATEVWLGTLDGGNFVGRPAAFSDNMPQAVNRQGKVIVTISGTAPAALPVVQLTSGSVNVRASQSVWMYGTNGYQIVAEVPSEVYLPQARARLMRFDARNLRWCPWNCDSNAEGTTWGSMYTWWDEMAYGLQPAISKIVLNRIGHLVGMFVNGQFAASAVKLPSNLDYSSLGLDYQGEIQLNQPFLIGDGYSSASEQMEFIVPEGATKVVFGMLDGWSTDNYDWTLGGTAISWTVEVGSAAGHVSVTSKMDVMAALVGFEGINDKAGKPPTKITFPALSKSVRVTWSSARFDCCGYATGNDANGWYGNPYLFSACNTNFAPITVRTTLGLNGIFTASNGQPSSKLPMYDWSNIERVQQTVNVPIGTAFLLGLSRTSSNQRITFVPPADATELWLGTMDACSYGSCTGCWADNRELGGLVSYFVSGLPTYSTAVDTRVTVRSGMNLQKADGRYPFDADGEAPAVVRFGATTESSGQSQTMTVDARTVRWRTNPSSTWSDGNGLSSSWTLDPTTKYSTISAVKLTSYQALIAVFLDEGGSSAYRASALDYQSMPKGQDSAVAPQLGQVFFVGTGYHSDGTQRSFQVPLGATQVHFGFSDTGFNDNQNDPMVGAAIRVTIRVNGYSKVTRASVSSLSDVYAAATGWMRVGNTGIPPAKIALDPVPGRQLTVVDSDVLLSCCGDAAVWDADGGSQTYWANTYPNGLYAYSRPDVNIATSRMPLLSAVGVFTANNALPDVKPAEVSYFTTTSAGAGWAEQYTSISPRIGEPFFLGNGYSRVSNVKQTVVVPDTATELWIGTTDAWGGNGEAGAFSDNIFDVRTRYGTHTVMVAAPGAASFGTSVSGSLRLRSTMNIWQWGFEMPELMGEQPASIRFDPVSGNDVQFFRIDARSVRWSTSDGALGGWYTASGILGAIDWTCRRRNTISTLSSPNIAVLIGAFLDDRTGSYSAPRLSYTALTSLDGVRPELGQAFIIGDGFRTTGEQMSWQVPAGATRLVLGFLDGCGYSDNTSNPPNGGVATYSIQAGACMTAPVYTEATCSAWVYGQRTLPCNCVAGFYTTTNDATQTGSVTASCNTATRSWLPISCVDCGTPSLTAIPNSVIVSRTTVRPITAVIGCAAGFYSSVTGTWTTTCRDTSSGSSGGWTAISGQCLSCNLATAPVIAGTTRTGPFGNPDGRGSFFRYTCDKGGFWGLGGTYTCDSTTGGNWVGSVACNACGTASIANQDNALSTIVNNADGVGGAVGTFPCAVGFFAPQTKHITRVCSTSTSGWTVNTVQCQPCVAPTVPPKALEDSSRLVLAGNNPISVTHYCVDGWFNSRNNAATFTASCANVHQAGTTDPWTARITCSACQDPGDPIRTYRPASAVDSPNGAPFVIRRSCKDGWFNNKDNQEVYASKCSNAHGRWTAALTCSMCRLPTINWNTYALGLRTWGVDNTPYQLDITCASTAAGFPDPISNRAATFQCLRSNGSWSGTYPTCSTCRLSGRRRRCTNLARCRSPCKYGPVTEAALTSSQTTTIDTAVLTYVAPVLPSDFLGF